MVAVILGAFGAHALKARLDVGALANWETAVRYQFYHVFAIITAAWLADKSQDKLALRAGWLFFIGILLFSGSLYFLSLRNLLEMNLLWLGPITPLGGLAFISGWVCLFISFRRFFN
jgi:uncharacterized membrane protein YgdD (TMEM256/DUF423 family)